MVIKTSTMTTAITQVPPIETRWGPNLAPVLLVSRWAHRKVTTFEISSSSLSPTISIREETPDLDELNSLLVIKAEEAATMD